MSPLPTSNHSNLIYIAQQGDTSLLQRYDVTTGSQQTIVQTQASEIIQQANVSPDGQWLLLRSLLQGQVAIQLIRVNGQQLQTLYCAPVQENIADALLSPAQHTLVFNQEDQNDISTLYLLDVATGKLHIALSPLQPNYPEIAQGPAQTPLMSEHAPSTVPAKTIGALALHPFNPLSSKHYLIYVPMKWANNTSLYVYGTVRASGAPLHQLALLRDIHLDVTQQNSNLQLITTSGQNFICQDNDVTPDNAQQVCSDYTFMLPGSPPNAIKMEPITGGSYRTVYQGQPGERIIARAVSTSTLLLLLNQNNGLASLWKMHTDGSGLTQLLVTQSVDIDLEFASSSYLPWSLISRDGTHYALTMNNMTSNASALLVGNLNGGQPKTIASNSAGLQLVGWP